MPDLSNQDGIKIRKTFGKYELLNVLGENRFDLSIHACNATDWQTLSMKIVYDDKVLGCLPSRFASWSLKAP